MDGETGCLPFVKISRQKEGAGGGARTLTQDGRLGWRWRSQSLRCWCQEARAGPRGSRAAAWP